MSFEKIIERISHSECYSFEMEEDVLRVESIDNGSQFIVENFSSSFQIRQAVLFDCTKIDDLEINQLHILCSRVNERFSGCKCFIDQWDVLVNASDLLFADNLVPVIESIFDQVEFVSQALLELLDVLRTSHRLPSYEDLDAAFQVPSIQ